MQRDPNLMKLVFTLSAFIFLNSFSIKAQQTAEVKFNLEGQLAATTDGRGIFINVGGPAVKFNFKKVAFSLQMMPSLRFHKEIGRPLVTPMLGCGPQIYFLRQRRLILSFPAYYYSSSHVWHFTAGLGYVINFKK